MKKWFGLISGTLVGLVLLVMYIQNIFSLDKCFRSIPKNTFGGLQPLYVYTKYDPCEAMMQYTFIFIFLLSIIFLLLGAIFWKKQTKSSKIIIALIGIIFFSLIVRAAIWNYI